MAIKLTSDSIVRVIRPESRKFNLDELNNHVEGFIEPLKIGPVWVMYSDTAKKEGQPLNKVASFFFDVAIYGAVLVVPPHQLPADWDLMEPEDYKYTADDIDNGFLLSLQSALIHNRVFGAPGPDENLEKLISRFDPIEEWTYKPPVNDEIDENTADFYRQVYDYISRNPDKFKSNILLSENDLIIKLEDPQDKEKIIQQMIDYFVTVEEYEKCSILKQHIE
jgi:hypothetical protein